MIDFVAIPERRRKGLKNKKKPIEKLERLTGADIDVDTDVRIECEDPLLMMRIKAVIKAYGRGFEFEDALYLLDESYELCIINMKDFTKSRNRMRVLRGRVIGSKGKTKDIIEKTADVKLSVSGKTVSIIGKWNNTQLARQAVCMLLEGRKHGTIYRYLEESLKKTKT